MPRGADEQHSQATVLVNAFLASATAAFRPLVDSPSATWSCKVEHSTTQGFVETSPDAISGFFFVTASFANDLVAGQVTFGDREYDLNTVLGPAKGSARYALWEWAAALDQPALVPVDTGFVMTVDRLEAIVRAMAAGVRALEGAIAAGRSEIIERMEHARARVREHDQARLREDDHRRAGALAAEAFRIHDFRRVVALLEAVEGSLTPAERKKLTYARQHS